jgi:hypothetical protein
MFRVRGSSSTPARSIRGSTLDITCAEMSLVSVSERCVSMLSVRLVAIVFLVGGLYPARCTAVDARSTGDCHREGSNGLIWKIDLVPTGYRSDASEVTENGASVSQSAFGSNDEAVILNTSTTGQNGELRIRAFVIDAGSGAARVAREWKMLAGSGVFGTAAGGYIVLTDGTVVYSRGLKEEIARSPEPVMMMSSGGTRVALRKVVDRKPVWFALDAQSLAEIGRLGEADQPSISDDALTDVWLGLPGGPVIRIESPGKPLVQFQPSWGVGRPYFVSNDAVAVLGERDLDVISVNGQRLFSTHVKGEDQALIGARDGERMALVDVLYGGHDEVVKYEEITVFDLRVGRAIWSVKNKCVRGRPDGISSVALSPDGSKLLINSHGIVGLYQMPRVVNP